MRAQPQAEGPSRTCNESQEEVEVFRVSRSPHQRLRRGFSTTIRRARQWFSKVNCAQTRVSNTTHHVLLYIDCIRRVHFWSAFWRGTSETGRIERSSSVSKFGPTGSSFGIRDSGSGIRGPCFVFRFTCLESISETGRRQRSGFRFHVPGFRFRVQGRVQG